MREHCIPTSSLPLNDMSVAQLKSSATRALRMKSIFHKPLTKALSSRIFILGGLDALSSSYNTTNIIVQSEPIFLPGGRWAILSVQDQAHTYLACYDVLNDRMTKCTPLGALSPVAHIQGRRIKHPSGHTQIVIQYDSKSDLLNVLLYYVDRESYQRFVDVFILVQFSCLMIVVQS